MTVARMKSLRRAVLELGSCVLFVRAFIKPTGDLRDGHGIRALKPSGLKVADLT
jgi:hypothetical protein